MANMFSLEKGFSAGLNGLMYISCPGGLSVSSPSVNAFSMAVSKDVGELNYE